MLQVNFSSSEPNSSVKSRERECSNECEKESREKKRYGECSRDKRIESKDYNYECNPAENGDESDSEKIIFRSQFVKFFKSVSFELPMALEVSASPRFFSELREF